MKNTFAPIFIASTFKYNTLHCIVKHRIKPSKFLKHCHFLWLANTEWYWGGLMHMFYGTRSCANCFFLNCCILCCFSLFGNLDLLQHYQIW